MVVHFRSSRGIKRWLALLAVALPVLWARQASAQLAPTGSHYAARSSDTGNAGPSDGGNYTTSLPLDLPAARGGLPIPLQIVYGGKTLGAAGVGWDVPLSFVQFDGFITGRRPAYAPGDAVSARNRVLVSLPGRQIEMVQQGSSWVGRNAPDLTMQFEADRIKVFDGNGRTYTFKSDPISGPFYLNGTGLHLLESIAGPGGSRVELTYDIAADPRLPFSFEPVSIELVQVRYNPHPSGGCFKHAVNLVYEPSADGKALSMSVLGRRLRQRNRTLTGVNVTSRASCGHSPERVHRYSFDYQNDADTHQPRLVSVRMFGRDGSPEASASLPLATYAYAAATTADAAGNRTLQFTTDAPIPVPLVAGVLAISGPLDASVFTLPSGWSYGDVLRTITEDAPSPSPRIFGTKQTLQDLTGDGRADIVYTAEDGSLWIARNIAAPEGTRFAAAALLNDNAFTRTALDIRSSAFDRLDRDEKTGLNVDNVWTQTIDVNGDGRLDFIDAAESAYHWVVYLNTPDTSRPSEIRWERRAFDIAPLHALFRQRGHIRGTNPFLPLSQRVTARDHAVWACWIWDSADDVYVRWPVGEPYPGFVPGALACLPDGEPPLTGLEREETAVEWEVRDVNGDTFPDVVFNSTPVSIFGDVSPPRQFEGLTVTRREPRTLSPGAGNKVEVVFNVAGSFISEHTNATFPFSAAQTYADHGCGVGLWASSLDDTQSSTECMIGDVTGDGVADYVTGRSVIVGVGSGLSTFEFRLPDRAGGRPGRASVQDNNYQQKCFERDEDGHFIHETYQAFTTAALRDITADGIPDYLEQTATTFRVHVGTGVGFNEPIPLAGAFPISHSDESCLRATVNSRTSRGLYDLDGDGRPERVRPVDGGPGAWAFETLSLAGGSSRGNPEAGQLVRVGNGYGADTVIEYVCRAPAMCEFVS